MECLCCLGSKAAAEQEMRPSDLWGFVSPSAVLFHSQDISQCWLTNGLMPTE